MTLRIPLRSKRLGLVLSVLRAWVDLVETDHKLCNVAKKRKENQQQQKAHQHRYNMLNALMCSCRNEANLNLYYNLIFWD